MKKRVQEIKLEAEILEKDWKDNIKELYCVYKSYTNQFFSIDQLNTDELSSLILSIGKFGLE